MRFSIFSTIAVIFTVAVTTLVAGGRNGGSDCAGCVLVVGLAEQMAQIHNSTIDKELDKLCNFIPSKSGAAFCTEVINGVMPIIIRLIEDEATADVVCHGITMCKQEPGTAFCHLFPPRHLKQEADLETHVAKMTRKYGPEVMRVFAERKRLGKETSLCAAFPHLCLWDEEGRNTARRALQRHTPDVTISNTPPQAKFDTDKDLFSTVPTLRGYDWRGKDCDDLDANIYPGRLSDDAFLDSNCNGVVGIASGGKTYEQTWCEGTQPMGVGILGDSATAHFRIPPNYLTAADISLSNFKNVLTLLENEGDWPMYSWSTGHKNISAQFQQDIQGPVNSVYIQMARRNRCNYGDYQNIGVNGAQSNNLVAWAESLKRNGSDIVHRTKPMIVFTAMIGNDVCGSTQNFAHMTTPKAYHDNVLAAVKVLDGKLPNGSKVILVDVVDGRVLYDAMHNRIHPIGSTNQDVTYRTFYDFLNCLDISPCWGWMNSNETVRNLTTAHGEAMNAELPKIVRETKGKLQNIELFFLGDVMDNAIKHAPIPLWELIEPVDGFHPSQLGNALIAEAFWMAMEKNGNILPPVNPFNAQLIAKFGPIDV